ncbi:MAG: LEA type 2 family protein, partial [Candidatus Omnitrophica bacterium]|nr:LEA type 2 family protein [Candidatus Omnitrophota bacterium]
MTAAILSTLLLASCASIQELAQVQKPQVEFTNLRLDKLDLQQLGLVADLKVNNPNSVGLSLSKLDYRFLVEGNPLVSGTQDQGLQLAAKSTSQLEIPITVNSADLWQTIGKVSKQDYFNYTLASVLTFALPVIGNVQLPLEKTGQLPVLRPPVVKVAGLKRRALSLTGADLELAIQVENPNAFTLMLNQFAYNFQVNSRSWATGTNTQPQRIDSKQTSEIRVPIKLNFLEMGMAAYQLLSSKAPLEYRLDGQFDFGSSEAF